MRAAPGEDEGFEEGVRGQAVGAVDAGAGDFADGVEARDAGAAEEVGADAAHPVVRGGGDGDGFVGPVKVAGAGFGVDGGEALREVGGGLRGDIEEDGLVVLGGHLAGDAAGDDVAGGEFGGGVDVLHEAAVVVVEKGRAFAADGLGDEEGSGGGGLQVGGGEGGGVELVELEVGEVRAGAESHGDAVAGGYGGVGGMEEELACAAGGEDDGVGGEGGGGTVLVDDAEADDGARGVEDEVLSEGVFEDGDGGVGADGTSSNRLDERGLDGEAGCVSACVKDARVGVGGFEALGEVAVVVVEGDAEADEVADAGGAFGAEDFDGCGVAEAGSGGEGVGDVGGGGVVGEHGGGDATLGPAGVGFGERGLGHKGDVVLGAELDGGDEAGDAAAHYQNVFRFRHV